MEQNDQIKEFFQQRLSDHQEVVRPEIWAAVSSAIATPVLVTTGISILSKTLIGLGIAASVIVSAYLLFSPDDKGVKAPTEDKKKAKEVPSIIIRFLQLKRTRTLFRLSCKKTTIY